MNDTTRCLPPGVNASVYCTSECHNQSGQCLHGCVEGWYGPRCSSPCSAGCRGGRCDAVGVCVDECIARYSLEFCNDTCEMCRDGVCDQKTGTCINGCDVSKRGCGTSCTRNCSRDYCINEICSDERPTGISESAHGPNIGLLLACVLFVLAILVSSYVCYRKGHTKQRNTADHGGTIFWNEITDREDISRPQHPSAEQPGPPSRSRSSDYCDVDEGAMGPVIVYL